MNGKIDYVGEAALIFFEGDVMKWNTVLSFLGSFYDEAC